MEIRVLGFGDNVVDKYEHEGIMYPGGNCLNFAVYARMIGVSRAAYMGYFGNDDEGEHVIETLREIGVETVKCRQLEGENGYTKVDVEDGERIFKYTNYGGIRGKTKYILDRFDLEYMRGFDLVHSGNYSFMEEELWKIRKENIQVSFDFSDIFEEDYIKEVCKNITYAFISCPEDPQELIKEKLEKLRNWGVSKAVATRGTKPAAGFDGTDFYEQEPVILAQVEDTMGAGDSFITAFLIEELKQKKTGQTDMQKSLREGTAFAASVCMKKGAFGYGKRYRR